MAWRVLTAVVSDAVEPDVLEVKVMPQRGRVMLSHSQGLQRFTSDYFVVAVTGTHCKSTTASMLTTCPCILSGGSCAYHQHHAPAGRESNDRDESRLLSQQLTERVVGVPTEHAGSLDELYRRLYEDFNVLVDRREFQRQLVVLILGAGNMQMHRLAEIVNGHSGNISLHS